MFFCHYNKIEEISLIISVEPLRQWSVNLVVGLTGNRDYILLCLNVKLFQTECFT